MTTLGHAVNQASVRRLVRRFTYTPKHSTTPEEPKTLRIAKEALDTLNAFVANYTARLFIKQEHFHLTLEDVDRVRLDQTWLNKKLQLDNGIPASLVRKQIEQHLTHALVAACNTTLDCGRATVTAPDMLRPLMLTLAILNQQTTTTTLG